MNVTYLDALNTLYALNVSGGVKLGLDNVLRLDALLGHPHRDYRSIHIAGTNGKGSVAWKIASALQKQGRRVGLFTSPHISSFRERIRIDGQLISEVRLIEGVQRLTALADSAQIPVTFFELTALLALWCFQQEGVDDAVVEVGLGGRLDATNIIQPELAVITSIGFDHMQFLGETLEKITGEKAGILKPGIPAVIGPHVNADWLPAHCDAVQVRGHFENTDLENRAIAHACLEKLHVEADEQSLSARPPCRLQQLSAPDFPDVEVLLDVAHNAPAMQRLTGALEVETYHVVLGLNSDKDVETISPLAAWARSITCVSAAHPRACGASELAERLRTSGCASVDSAPSVVSGVERQVARAHREGGKVLVCGSVFIMAEARRALGIEEPSDPSNLNEVLKPLEMTQK